MSFGVDQTTETPEGVVYLASYGHLAPLSQSRLTLPWMGSASPHVLSVTCRKSLSRNAWHW